MKGRIKINRERCKGCGLCIMVCPKKRIQTSEELNATGYYPAQFQEENVKEIERIQCTGCALCAVTCPDVAIEVYRQTKDDSEKKKNTQRNPKKHGC